MFYFKELDNIVLEKIKREQLLRLRSFWYRQTPSHT